MRLVVVCLVLLVVTCVLLTIGSCTGQGTTVQFKITTIATGLADPYTISVLSNNDIYVGEFTNDVVKKISGGTTTVIAGGGSGSGNNVPATQVELNGPGILYDETSGSLYIAEFYNDRIRVVSNGNIKTLVDVNGPWGMTLDQTTQRLYFTTEQYVKYMKTDGTGSATTVVSGLSNPDGMTISYSRNIYFSEIDTRRIKTFPVSTGAVSTFAGTGTKGKANGDLSTAQLYSPRCLAYTTADELYFSDGDNHRIRKVYNNMVSNFAGTGSNTGSCNDNTDPLTCAMDEPNGIFVTSKNEIYVSELGSGSIRKIYPYCDANYQLASDGRSCLPICYGKVSTDPTACSGKGSCSSPDNCVCNSQYGGSQCEYPKCNGTISIQSSVCSQQGSCDDVDICNCFNTSRYGGKYCEIPKCYGTLANETNSVCSGRGNCIGVDNCQCKTPSQWGGSQCEIQKCNSKLSTDPTVCNSRGSCNSPNMCQCNNPSLYGGNDCELFKCNGTLSNQTGIVCSGRGNCLENNICQCDNTNLWGGRFCEIPKCYGILANETTKCSSRGECTSPNNCQCYESNKYGGPECETFKCNGILSTNTSYVCSGKGTCNSLNNCACFTNYDGTNCELVKCFGKLQNDSTVCSGKGSCKNVDTCQCFNGYGGTECNLINCFGIFTNQTNLICNNGNGTCIAPDNCQCNSGWIGQKCNVAICNGKFSNDTNACSGKGQCMGPNNCKCSTNYYGTNCEKTTCDSIASDSSSVCYGNGDCLSFNTCSCKSGYGPSSTCQYPICFGLLANDTRVCNDTDKFCFAPNDCKPKNPICFGIEKLDSRSCSGHGICLSTDNCKCDSSYFGEQCQYFKCNGVEYNSTAVCSSHGSCDSVNNCNCLDGYGGSNCELAKCNGILQNSTLVCSGRGNCTGLNQCKCDYGYYGSDCQFTTCFGFEKGTSQVCNYGNGTCLSFDNCKCVDESKWFGVQCNSTYCYGITSTDSSVCNSQGACLNFNTCQCKQNFVGDQCQLKYLSQSMTLSFNSTTDFVGEISTILTLNIQDSTFIDFYTNKSIDVKLELLLDSQPLSTIQQQLSSASSTFSLPSTLSKGSLTAKATLLYNSTPISFKVETSSPLAIQQRNTPSTSPQSSGPSRVGEPSIKQGNDNAGIIAVAVVVPIVAIAAIGGSVAIIITVVVLLKKKAAATLAKDIAAATHTDVELVAGI